MKDDDNPVEPLRQSLFLPRKDIPTESGARSRLRDTSRRLSDLIFERGLETSQRAVELEHFHPDHVWYVPSDWLDLRRALRDWRVQSADVFADFGSGKGRVIYQAAQYPFSRVVGVEISEKLNEIARRNIETKKQKLVCRDIQIITADAVDYEIPDDLTVAYFFHPFAGTTFKRVIDNLIGSIERAPRRLRVIYQIPVMEKYLLSTGHLKLVRTIKRGADNPRRVAIYETVPHS